MLAREMKNDRSYLPVPGSKRSTSLSPKEYALNTFPLLCGPGVLLRMLGSWFTSTGRVGGIMSSPCEIASVEENMS